jgi:hypothetical protein
MVGARRPSFVFFCDAGNQHRVCPRLTRDFRRLEFAFRFRSFVGHDAIVEEVAHRACFDSKVYVLWQIARSLYHLKGVKLELFAELQAEAAKRGIKLIASDEGTFEPVEAGEFNGKTED